MGGVMEIGVKQAAELLKVSDKTIYRWLASSQIPFYRVGSQYRFSRNELLQWVKVSSTSDNEPAACSIDEAPVSLEQSVRSGGIFYRVGGVDVYSVLEHLLALMRLPTEIDTARILDLLYHREQVATTAIGDGIAFPHCRDTDLSGLSAPMVALGFLENPVDFFAINKQSVSIVFLYLSPSADANIRIMSRLVHAVRTTGFSSLLHARAMRGQLYEALAGIDQQLQG